MAKKAPTYKSILRRYERAPPEVQFYFDALPSLVRDYSLDVCLSYLFGRIELAHNMALYCGVVKLHKVDAPLARKAIDSHHISRDEFKALFATIFGKRIGRPILDEIEAASKVRDKVLHGKSYTEAELRGAVVDVIDYATKFNDLVFGIAGFKPFGSLKGFKGRAKSLEKSTSRWVLRGVGFGSM